MGKAIGFLLSGFMFGSGPCLISCGPLLIAYTVGTGKRAVHGLVFYSLFSAMRVLIYLVFGMAVFFLGKAVAERLLGAFWRYVFLISAGAVIFLGFIVLSAQGISFIKQHTMCCRISRFAVRLHNHMSGNDAKTAIVLGLLIGLAPCAPLLAMLSYAGIIAHTGISALFYSLCFGIGTTLSPLFIIIPAAGALSGFIGNEKIGLRRMFNIICGVMLIFFGLQLVARFFKTW